IVDTVLIAGKDTPVPWEEREAGAHDGIVSATRTSNTRFTVLAAQPPRMWACRTWHHPSEYFAGSALVGWSTSRPDERPSADTEPAPRQPSGSHHSQFGWEPGPAETERSAQVAPAVLIVHRNTTSLEAAPLSYKKSRRHLDRQSFPGTPPATHQRPA